MPDKTDTVDLATLTDEQLEETLRNRRKGKLDSMIATWEKVNGEQRKLAKDIQSVSPGWKPETLGEKIVAWLGEQKAPVTKEAIVAVFGKGTGLALSNIDESEITEKGGKYSVPAK